ncbi:DUF423 domain-containing protein [Jiulongibacter sp. NS-SX5]|uniref:DUF423 domain-containing protein n=1 Tax=Jiulongibacter sp. NS-SX5 TaxID=3463854 RepID=UPI00405959FF
MNKLFIVISAVFGFLAVALGAFGAHTLEPFLIEQGRLDTFETAVSYQFYHTLALLLTGFLCQFIPSKLLTYAGYAFTLGVIFFSGSLYSICFTGIKTFGAIAPIGGTAFIIGWVCIFLAALRK